jgi:hypothetical protein
MAETTEEQIEVEPVDFFNDPKYLGFDIFNNETNQNVPLGTPEEECFDPYAIMKHLIPFEAHCVSGYHGGSWKKQETSTSSNKEYLARPQAMFEALRELPEYPYEIIGDVKKDLVRKHIYKKGYNGFSNVNVIGIIPAKGQIGDEFDLTGTSTIMFTAHHDIVNKNTDNVFDNLASCAHVIALHTKLLKYRMLGGELTHNVVVVMFDEEESGQGGSREAARLFKSCPNLFGNVEAVLNLELTAAGTHFWVDKSYNAPSYIFKMAVKRFTQSKHATIECPSNDAITLRNGGIQAACIGSITRKAMNTQMSKDKKTPTPAIWRICHSHEDKLALARASDMAYFNSLLYNIAISDWTKEIEYSKNRTISKPTSTGSAYQGSGTPVNTGSYTPARTSATPMHSSATWEDKRNIVPYDSRYEDDIKEVKSNRKDKHRNQTRQNFNQAGADPYKALNKEWVIIRKYIQKLSKDKQDIPKEYALYCPDEQYRKLSLEDKTKYQDIIYSNIRNIMLQVARELEADEQMIDMLITQGESFLLSKVGDSKLLGLLVLALAEIIYMTDNSKAELTPGKIQNPIISKRRFNKLHPELVNIVTFIDPNSIFSGTLCDLDDLVDSIIFTSYGIVNFDEAPASKPKPIKLEAAPENVSTEVTKEQPSVKSVVTDIPIPPSLVTTPYNSTGSIDYKRPNSTWKMENLYQSDWDLIAPQAVITEKCKKETILKTIPSASGNIAYGIPAPACCNYFTMNSNFVKVPVPGDLSTAYQAGVRKETISWRAFRACFISPLILKRWLVGYMGNYYKSGGSYDKVLSIWKDEMIPYYLDGDAKLEMGHQTNLEMKGLLFVVRLLTEFVEKNLQGELDGIPGNEIVTTSIATIPTTQMSIPLTAVQEDRKPFLAQPQGSLIHSSDFSEKEIHTFEDEGGPCAVDRAMSEAERTFYEALMNGNLD